ncbi:hypothetical protein [Peribacillus butanolivorans]|uniref:hypothetical protein n=1 Tax=Peribacillus butanolivorans TaxID=421767 RepID=UPI0037F94BAB
MDNVLKEDFTTHTIIEKWVATISYKKDRWCYLASVLDLHSMKIVGYLFSRSKTTELAIKERAHTD